MRERGTRPSGAAVREVRGADLEVLGEERAEGLPLVEAVEDDEHPPVEHLLAGPDVPVPPRELPRDAGGVVVLCA